MIKVLNIISDTNIGGAGRCLVNYLKYADKSRFESSVILPKNSELTKQLRPLGVKITEIDGMADKSYSPKAMKELMRLIRLENPDIVHTHGSLTGRIAARKCGKKVLFTRHSAFPFPGYVRKTPAKYLYKFLYEHYSDKIIAVSRAGAEQLIDGGISESKIEVIMNGVEALQPISDDDRRAFRTAIGVTDEEFLMGVLARIEEYKGHKDMVDALKILKGRNKAVKLLVAGEGSYESELREYVKESGLENEVIFMGFVKDVAPALAAMDVQLNASYISETSSLSLIEGMSLGVPAIASDCSGNPYLIENGKNGLLFTPRDAKALADCVEQVMDSQTLKNRLSVQAREIFEERFTSEIFAGRIEEIYNKTMEDKDHE